MFSLADPDDPGHLRVGHGSCPAAKNIVDGLGERSLPVVHCCFDDEYCREAPGRCRLHMTLVRDISEGYLEAAPLQLRTDALIGDERPYLTIRLSQAIEDGPTSGSVCSYNDHRHARNLHDCEGFPHRERSSTIPLR